MAPVLQGLDSGQGNTGPYWLRHFYGDKKSDYNTKYNIKVASITVSESGRRGWCAIEARGEEALLRGPAVFGGVLAEPRPFRHLGLVVHVRVAALLDRRCR